MSKEKPVLEITRLDFIIIVLISLAIGAGILSLNKAEAGEVELAPAPEVVKVQPVPKEEELSSFEKLKVWLRSFSNEDDEPRPVAKMEGQQLSTETVEELEFIFNSKSQKTADEIMERAEFDAKQIDCLVRNQVFEAAGESKLGQLWVYHVVKNRTDKEYRGNTTVCETIFDPKQFSWANTNPDRVPEFTADVDVATELVNQLYYDDDLEDITCGATHYLKKNIMWDVDWSREALLGKSKEDLELIAIIGKHAFFGKPEC